MRKTHGFLAYFLALFITSTPVRPANAQSLQQPQEGDLKVIAIPVAPAAGTTASIAVYASASCATTPSTPSLLKDGMKNVVSSGKKIVLVMANALQAGQQICAVETFSAGGTPAAVFPAVSVKNRIVSPDPVTKVTVLPTAAGDTTVSIQPIPAGPGYTATIDLYAICPAPGTTPVGSPLEDEGVDNSVDLDTVVTLQLKIPVKAGDQFCAVETYVAGGGIPAKSSSTSAVATVVDQPDPPAAEACPTSAMPNQVLATEKLIQAWPDPSCSANPKKPVDCSASAQKLRVAVTATEQMLKYCASNANTSGDYNRAWYVEEADNWAPLDLDMVEHSNQIADGTYLLPAAWKQPPHPAPPFYSGSPYVRGLLGGTYSAASGTDPQGKLLADVFIDLPLHSISKEGPTRWWAWGYAHIGSIGQAQSAVDPTQIATQYAQLSNAKPGQVVQSFEMNAGVAFQIVSFPTDVDMFKQVTVSAIGGGGALTPVSPAQIQPSYFQITSDVEDFYKKPPYNADFTACTANGNSLTNCYLQLYNQDRSRFFRNYEYGIRLKAYPKADPTHVAAFPAMFDVTWGQSEYVTGGTYNGHVLRLVGSSPILNSGFYAFGGMEIGIGNKADSPGPLLIPVTTPPITSTVIIPVAVPAYNRDRYSLGIGIDIIQLIRSHALQDALNSVHHQ